MALPNSQIQETFRDLVNDPNYRFHKFFEFYTNVNLKPDFGIEKYLRSGKEIIRMANVYYSERDFFHAFVLYSRFIILVLEKIPKHLQYSIVNKSELAEINKQVKTIAFPRAEKLKKYIKDIFEAEQKEYEELMKVEEEKKKNQKNLDNDKLSIADGVDLDALKKKYNFENENELRQLQEKELNSILNFESGQLNQNENTGNNKPVVDRSLKPKTRDPNQPNNYNLRTIMVPSDLTTRFLDVSLANTNRNIETCGILCGKLSQNVFILSHVIIPKQTGSSDTCHTEQENELFDTIDQLNLITLGWIHTHPSQTAFLSSVDLHTQFGYQIMIPEAIAIVCAPSYNENRTFILTPTYGIKEIAECNLSGFHPHTNNPPVFEDCDHVREDSKLKVNLIDLRMTFTVENSLFYSRLIKKIFAEKIGKYKKKIFSSKRII